MFKVHFFFFFAKWTLEAAHVFIQQPWEVQHPLLYSEHAASPLQPQGCAGCTLPLPIAPWQMACSSGPPDLMLSPNCKPQSCPLWTGQKMLEDSTTTITYFISTLQQPQKPGAEEIRRRDSTFKKRLKLDTEWTRAKTQVNMVMRWCVHCEQAFWFCFQVWWGTWIVRELSGPIYKVDTNKKRKFSICWDPAACVVL